MKTKRTLQNTRWLALSILILLGAYGLATLFSATAQQSSPLAFEIKVVDATTGATKSSFYLGEPIKVVFTVTNQSATPQTIVNLEQAPIPVTLSATINGEDGVKVYNETRGGTTGPDTVDGNIIYHTVVAASDVTLAPGQQAQVTIDDLSQFFARRFADGSYTFSAAYDNKTSQAAFTISIVAAQSVPVLQQLATSQDEYTKAWANSFLDLINKPSISGRVADSNGVGISGVDFTITGAYATNLQTGSDGRYDLTRLAPGSNVALTPSKEGYTFEPTSLAFNNLTTKQTNVNFTATKGAAGDSVAAANNGATVTASSTFDDDYPAESVINGSTNGDWGTGTGGWQDATLNTYPDWIEVNFGASKAIDWINVYTLADNFQNATEPLPTDTFTLYGIVDFDVQYWNGSGWVTVPGGEVNGNNRVWRKFSFPTITTSKIRVNVRNAIGGYSRITEIEAFHVNKPPTVSIPGTLQGAPGTAVQFSSTVTDDGSISSYEWNFGDNSTGAGPNPSHTYTEVGTYTVTLTVTDNDGETATATRTITISGPPQPPVANPGGPYAGLPGTSIILDGRRSSDPDGNIASYLWEFGDGTSAPGAAPSHTYSQSGTYTARLTVTDNSGSTASATATVTIATSQPPPSNLTGITNCQVHLHWVDNSTDETGFIVERSTDNGQTYSTFQTLPPNTTQALNLPRPDHTQGSFTYRVRATNAQGVSAPSNLYVADPLCQGCSCDSSTPSFAPDVKMTAPATGTTVGAGSSVALVAQVSSTNALTSVKFYQGTTFIGDGVLVSPPTNPPSYVFSWQNVSAGTYSLTAKATDTGGLIGTSPAVSLSVIAPPTVSITSPANNARFAPPGSITINASASATNATVTKVEFFEGMNKIGEDTSSPYSFAWNNVASGAYQLTAKATASNQLSATSTAVAVIVNSLPVVTLTSPTAGQVFSAPGQITIAADASETNGTISKVDFYRGPTLIGTATTAPYKVTWSNVAQGSYLINAIATDSFNVIASSGSINVYVGNPPSVSITSPVDEAILPPSIKTISAAASTPNGSITKVEFFQGAIKIGEDLTAPFSIQWANSTSGRYQLTAKATDAIGLTVTSAPVSVLVGLPPIVSLTAPADGQVFAPGNISLSATASDVDGTITQVDFFEGTTLIGTDTTSPYTFTWNGVASGMYSITARATDNAGLRTTSSPSNIVVNTSPSVSITSPANRAMLSPGSNIVIDANATDADGTISQVDFYQGTTLIASDNTSPYSITWNDVASASYVLSAKATDNNGAVTTSASIVVTTPVFFDDFNDNSLNAAKWSLYAPSSPATVSEIGQQLQIALPASTATYNGVVSNATYDMRGATVQVELSQPVSQAGWAENRLQIEKDAANSLMINVGAGSILFRQTVNGAQDQAVISYDFTAHRHWRIRHDAGSNVVSFETSPDAVTWTTRKTATAGFSFTGMKFQMIAGAWGTGNSAPGAAIFNDFQYISDLSTILGDDFNDNSIDTAKWNTTNLFSGFTDTALPVSETGQRFEIGPLLQNTSGSHYRGLVSVNAYDFTNGAAYVELVQPAASTTNGDAMFTIGPNVDNFYRLYVNSGQLIGQKKIGGTKTTVFTISYDSVNHRFLRIRHDAGSMIMETAPANGSAPGTWVQRYSELWNSSVVLTSTLFEVKGGTSVAETNAPGKVIFDNFVFKRNGQAPVPPPTLSSVSPASGPAAGGTSLTLTGTQFVTGATVSVGGTSATNVNVASSTSITATAPAHAAGSVSVVVTNPDGQSATQGNAYTYVSSPTLSSVSPTSGPIAGGTSLTLTGTQFVSGATVTVGGVSATSVNVASSTSITATAPAHTAGSVSVVVTNPDGGSVTLNNAFTYTLPSDLILEDNFDDNSINTSKWTTTDLFSGFTDTGLPVNETSGRFEIGPLLLNTSGSHYRGLRSVNTFDFTNGSAYVELVQAASSSTQGDAMFTIGPNVDNYYRIYVSGGQLIGQRKVAGTKTTLFTITYVPADHRFLRIRHSAGSMIMETAPTNGSGPGTWTPQYIQIWSSSVLLTSTYFEVKGGTWQAEANAAGKVIFDNFIAYR